MNQDWMGSSARAGIMLSVANGEFAEAQARALLAIADWLADIASELTTTLDHSDITDELRTLRDRFPA